MDLTYIANLRGEETKTEDGYDKHISRHGSREHVLRYSNIGVHCSHKNCVVNRDNQDNVKDWIFLN